MRAGFLALHAGVLMTALLAAGCRKSVPATPPPETLAAAPKLKVNTKSKWLYTYADPEGRFVTTDSLASVPVGSRRLVRVVDPAPASPQAAAGATGVVVQTVDADELEKRGEVEARPMSREAFETGAIAQLPPGESSALSAAPPEAANMEAQADGGVSPAPTNAVVTIYGTSWCSACKAARAYLRGRKIPFADKDIERDPAAARTLREKAAAMGVPADRVPVLDVRGRLLIGFDKARLEAMLGEAT